jgi:ferredoxin--NADP+ reductase/benzoate/toluate 1,2-dioxygenase reductase subunit
MREYSIYSSVDADYLDILIKEVDDGTVSRELHMAEPGDRLHVEGPFGSFLMPEDFQAGQRSVVLVSTGTGISPMRSFIESYPGLDYTLIHGVRTLAEKGEYECFDSARVHCCVSREVVSSPFFSGRVTHYLQSQSVDRKAVYFLCGNGDMIYDVYDILKKEGLPADSIKTEVYF